jgi:hypothetical protein
MLPDDIMKTTGCSRFSRLKISDPLACFAVINLSYWRRGRLIEAITNYTIGRLGEIWLLFWVCCKYFREFSTN